MPTALTPRTLTYGFTPAGDPDVSPEARASSTPCRPIPSQRNPSARSGCAISMARTPAALTSAGTRNRAARWSPDGRRLPSSPIASSKNGLFVLPMAGGEARELPTIDAPSATSPGRRTVADRLHGRLRPRESRTASSPPEGAAPASPRHRRIDYKQDNRGYLNDTPRAGLRRRCRQRRAPAGHTPRQSTTAAPCWSPDGTHARRRRLDE